MSGNQRAVVLVPTYNEVESLPATIDRLLRVVDDVHVLVIDDASPDGTGDLAEKMAAADDRVNVLHRPARMGLGTAYVDGMRWALDQGADLVIEMDADGSHPPESLPGMLQLAEHADLVIGSRWVPGGAIRDWPVRRQLISKFANLYARVLLDLPVADITAGFRVYRSDILAAADFSSVRSDGYCFQIDLTRRVIDAGGVVVETPIEFVERRHGASKMTSDVIVESAVKVLGWGVGRRAAGFVDVLRAARHRP